MPDLNESTPIMRRLRRSFILRLFFGLTCLSLLQAQTENKGASDSNAPAASPASTGQAPDDATKKITELVHERNYAAAQQLTAGLLTAYPNDQRLTKAKALIEKLLAPAGQAPPDGSQPAPSASSELLTGMAKVDYNGLIVLAHQAQQTTDLPEQKKLLLQFMDESSTFLQKHPGQMLVWQLRAAAAISLNDPMAGYAAGQMLIAAGAADSNDPSLEQLLGQLKSKHYLDKQQAETAARQAKYDWILGTVSAHFILIDKHGHRTMASWEGQFELSRSDAIIEGLYITDEKRSTVRFRANILKSGELYCEGTGWGQSEVKSCEVDSSKKTMTVFFTTAHSKDTDAWELKAN